MKRPALLVALVASLAGPGVAASEPEPSSAVARATHLPPWNDPGDASLGAWVRSARVLKADQPVLSGPWAAAPRRGSAALGALLPVFAARRGEGCQGRWLGVGPFAWVCQDAAELSGTAPIAASARTVREYADGLPYRYYFVGPDGSLGYQRIEAADVGEPDFELQPGFAVAIVEERTYAGARYGRTNNNLWVPSRDLGPVHPLAFRGEEIPRREGEVPREIGVAWVVADKAKVFAKPSAAAATVASRARFEAVPFLEESKVGPSRFTRIGESEWVASKDLRHPTMAAPPAEVDVAAGERWIDVELATQTLVAFEGAVPVFATLVSTGKGRQGTPTATPIGVHRVWVKLLSSNMDNLEDDNAARYYRMEDVPYVQYFAKGVGLHGAFWHRSFGHVRSHGCVNMTPLDAQRLFWWTSPRMPAGWTAVIPGQHEPGVVVRVR